MLLDQRQVLTDLAADLDLAVPGGLEGAYEDARLPFDGLADRMAAQIAAAREIERITDASSGVPGLIARIGLLGSALDPLVDQARIAFEAGDLARVDEKVQAFDDAHDEAEAEGWARVGAVVLALAAVVGVSLLAARLRRGRSDPFDHAPLEQALRPDGPNAAPEVEDIYAPPVHYDPSLAHPAPEPDESLPRREPSAQP